MFKCSKFRLVIKISDTVGARLSRVKFLALAAVADDRAVNGRYQQR